MLIVLRNRGDNEIKRAAIAALSIIVAIVVVVRARGSYNRSQGRNLLPGYPRYRNMLPGYPRYRAPALAPLGSCPIMANRVSPIPKHAPRVSPIPSSYHAAVRCTHAGKWTWKWAFGPEPVQHTLSARRITVAVALRPDSLQII